MSTPRPNVVDWTGRQYDPDVDVPHVEPWHTGNSGGVRAGGAAAAPVPTAHQIIVSWYGAPLPGSW
jgi:hypothetical protein